MRNINIPKDAISNMTKEELVSWLGTASKRANQRLRQLEKDSLATSSLAYQYVKTKEVDHSTSNAKTKNGETKFKTTFKNRTIQDLRRQAKDVMNFLKTKTSTSRGTRDKYQKALGGYNETMKKQWIEDGNSPESFTPATMDVWASIWASENMKKLHSMFDSNTILQIYQYGERSGISQAHMEEIVGMIVNRQNMDGITAYNEIHSTIDKYSKAIENGEIEPNGTDSLTEEDFNTLNNISSIY